MNNMNMSRDDQKSIYGMKAGWLRRNYFIWAGVYRHTKDMWHDPIPTVVIDVDLLSWALPLAVHAGGPLLAHPGFHLRVGPINIGWSRL